MLSNTAHQDSLKNPLIVQSDRSILLEVNNPFYESARDILGLFAELVKSPEHIHTYKITNLSLWNAAASGMSSDMILDALDEYGKYEVPDNVRADIIDYVSRYGRLKLKKEGDSLVLVSDDITLISEVWNNNGVKRYLQEQIDERTLKIEPGMRGHIKHALIELGFPAEDIAGYTTGDHLSIELLDETRLGTSFLLRQYQQDAIGSFYAGGSIFGGSGTIVLPCGAGKTMVGMGVMSKLDCHTLIITPNIIAARQWIDELVDKTTISKDDIGEYSGESKEIKPVTIATYQILSHRSKNDEFPHLKLFNERNWGLIIYDEVHLLPAPIFRITAEIQSMRRLGLTATLVREDGKETEVFSLIGPKKYDAPWKDLEKQGWIAKAVCSEIRISMPEEFRLKYAMAKDRQKYRISAENPQKIKPVKEIVKYHRGKGDKILIIGMYLDQLTGISKLLHAPLLTGKTPNKERIELYDRFRNGETDILVVSKVANFAIDLPDANVAVQISGTFGSRQEEAQRLGRILRPKKDGSIAHFYSIVTKDTRDQDFSAKRQIFLTEQGYRYIIGDKFVIPDKLAA
ncbi:MAG: Type III restriction enzyme, res subunit [Candidatus Methanolliviera sp. GoM_oil]|nr:MAG: Type III restriction enzyme, res subunit [Candidatus Methanolliviera sp. GoM_oil]